MSTVTRRRGRFHELEVAEVRPLTAESIEVTFAVPPDLETDYQYLPGQYVALRAHVDGHEVRRSYSICRPPTPGRISVGIKRDLGGLFSVWAHENLMPGDRIEVMSPEGMFTTNLPDLDHAHIAGIAAGSGVTPMMALTAHVLASSSTAQFSLVYT
ncbi:MAG: FAD-binding oxidoreductase, partial [Microbacterium sp.]